MPICFKSAKTGPKGRKSDVLVALARAFAPRPSYDVCVIGTGPAGLALVSKLRAKGLSVFLAEGGDREFSDDSQELYEGRIVGDEYFELETAFVLGFEVETSLGRAAGRSPPRRPHTRCTAAR